MIKLIRKYMLHRRLLRQSPFEQLLCLAGIVVENVDELRGKDPQKVQEAIFIAVQSELRRRITAGITAKSSEWGLWQRYEGGRILQAWYTHACISVEEIKLAKMVEVLADKLNGSGTLAENIALEYLSSEQQDAIIRAQLKRANHDWNKIS